MRRTIAIGVAVIGLLLGSASATLAAPAESADCIGEVATSFLHGDLGPVLSQEAQGVGLGWLVGGRGSGLAPTDPPDCN